MQCPPQFSFSHFSLKEGKRKPSKKYTQVFVTYRGEKKKIALKKSVQKQTWDTEH